MAELDPSTTSADYLEMIDSWAMIRHIRAGVQAVRDQGELYLPRHEAEADEVYENRLKSAPWRPEFEDALRSIIAKPFTKPVMLQGDTDERIKALAEDVDGKGHNLHVFAREAFASGVSMGLHAIYVAFPDPGEELRTVAAEAESGVRPYWVHIMASDILALYTKVVAGREVIEHMRIREDAIVRDGWDEKLVERVRVLELTPEGIPTSQLYEKNEAGDWSSGSVVQLIGPTSLPIVLYFTGERTGAYRVRPPLIDLAEMQMEVYRALSRKDQVLTYAGFPMLKAVGQSMRVDAEGNVVLPIIGPNIVLYAPAGADGKATDWDFVQPDAANIKEIRDDLDGLLRDFRRLSLQPSSPTSGSVTATGEAIHGAKSHSAIEAWANDLKDVLEQAFVYTCEWLKIQPTVEVSVHTDFGVDIDGGQDMAELTKARVAGEISRETYWDELARRGKLGPQFDPDDEEKRLQEEADATAELDMTALQDDPLARPVRESMKVEHDEGGRISRIVKEST